MTTLWNKKKFSQEEWDERFEKSCVLFDFAVLLAGLQHRAGRRFMLEQLAGVGSLQRDNVLEPPRDPTIYTTKFDQCRFGLVSPLGGPMKKATIFVTNSPGLHHQFHEVKCLGNHKHVRIEGVEAGHRLSAWAQNCPREMSDLIVRSMMSASDWDDPPMEDCDPMEAGEVCDPAFKRKLKSTSKPYEV